MEHTEHLPSRNGDSRHRIGTATKSLNRSLAWVSIWVLASVLPILPYAQPLWQDALADTPYAYLVWIPAFAFFWAAWSLIRIEPYKDDAELNGIMGILMMSLAGALLVFGMRSWAGEFVGNSVGLLIWPLWALGLAWLMFGIGVTKHIIRPLVYLMLAWLPIYSKIINITNPILENLANYILGIFSGLIPWLKASSQLGYYLVDHGGQWFSVQVSSACSGSDSFLAMAILLPIILVIFESSAIKKIALICLAAALAIGMNLLRLILLMISEHLFGSQFTFGILHPMLGMILFIFVIGLLAMVGKTLGMRSKTILSSGQLQLPGWTRAGIAVIPAVALTMLLWPIYGWVAGSFGVPIAVSTNNLTALMPQVNGYQRRFLGSFDEGSILGPGSYGRAFAYSSPQGRYAMAEEWLTYNLNTLQSYGVNNCLLFHGYTVLNSQTFDIRAGVPAQAFAILLPPSQPGEPRDAYEDVTYSYAVNYNGRNAYIRAEFMTPINYNVTGRSTLMTGLPLALAAQYGPTIQPLSAVPGLNSSERQTLQAFHSFITAFAARSLGAITPSKTVKNA